MQLRHRVGPAVAGELDPEKREVASAAAPAVPPALYESSKLFTVGRGLLRVVGVRFTLIPDHALDRQRQDGMHHLVVEDGRDLVDALPVGAEGDAANSEFPLALERASFAVVEAQRRGTIDSAAASGIGYPNREDVPADAERVLRKTVVPLQV